MGWTGGRGPACAGSCDTRAPAIVRGHPPC
jgi:hypothetical protein